MKTAIEAARDGLTPLRVFHMAGKGGRYQWTHLPDKKTRAACEACQRGTIPEAVLRGTQKSA